MRALKALVIGMGILIFVGLAVITVTLFKRATAPAITTGTMPTGDPAGALAAFGDVTLPIPADATIAEMRVAGERALLRVVHADGRSEILIVSLTDGRLIGRLKTEAAAP